MNPFRLLLTAVGLAALAAILKPLHRLIDRTKRVKISRDGIDATTWNPEHERRKKPRDKS